MQYAEQTMQCYVIMLDTSRTTYTFYKIDNQWNKEKNKYKEKRKNRRNKRRAPPGDVTDFWKERTKETAPLYIFQNKTMNAGKHQANRSTKKTPGSRSSL